VAIVLAMPLAYYLVNEWLKDFAYKTAIELWVFSLAAVITFAITLLTIAFQAYKVAVSNPVKSLRSE